MSLNGSTSPRQATSPLETAQHQAELALGRVGRKQQKFIETLAWIARANIRNPQEIASSQIALLDKYYEEALLQARQSFKLAMIAAGVGAGFFGMAVVSVLLLKAGTDVSIISVISGSIVQVISGINFWLYGKATNQLAAFHSRLDDTQRYLLANSLCENLDDEHKNAARSELIRHIAKVYPHVSSKNSLESSLST